ncbi:hypothetical protein IW262DRAFT_1396750 [Armillaria fumosa]|nr:hypothetical protein IW262DRAFT_1396750 [Armillaria fumosa]
MSDLCLYCGLRAAPSQSLHSRGSIYQHFDDKIEPTLRGHHIDTFVVKSAILAIERHLQSTDDQLNHLEVLRTRLLAERSHAAAELAKYRSFIAPIRRLPNEILSEIFSFACTVMSDSVGIVSGAPWVLSRVCSLWYGGVLETKLIMCFFSWLLQVFVGNCRYFQVVISISRYYHVLSGMLK